MSFTLCHSVRKMISVEVLRLQTRGLFDVNDIQTIISDIRVFLRVYHLTSSGSDLFLVYEFLLTAFLIKYSRLKHLPGFLILVNFLVKKITSFYLVSHHFRCILHRCQLCSLYQIFRRVLAMSFTEFGICWYSRN